MGPDELVQENITTELPDGVNGTGETTTTEEVQPKKRRGRKPKFSLSGEQETINIPGESTEPEPKKRKKRSKPFDALSAAKQVQGFHNFIAMVTGTPELMLAEAEAAALAKAGHDFSEEFGFEVSNKAVVVVSLIGTCAMIYVPRIGRIKQRVALARAQAEAEAERGGGIDPNEPTIPGYTTG